MSPEHRDRLFLVRAGAASKLIDQFTRDGIVAVGWERLGSLEGVRTAGEIADLMVDVYAEGRAGWRPPRHYMEIADFVLDIGPGTRVLTVDSKRRRVIVGTIVGDYEFWPESALFANDEPFRHVRRVRWEAEIPRDALQPGSRSDIDYPIAQTAVWLSETTSADILDLLDQGVGMDMIVGPDAIVDRVRPPEEAPLEQSALRDWMTANEAAAEELPAAYLDSKLEAADPVPRTAEVTSSTYVRNPYVVARVKQLARGICELCSEPAPFADAVGRPFLEAHHVEWLSRGGPDVVANVVALCPNCHRKMHIRDLGADVARLQARAQSRRS